MEVQHYDSTNDRLLPCPFCGEKPMWHRVGNEYTKSQKIVVKCPKCRIERTDAILNNHGHTIEWLEEVAIKNWNQRIKKISNMKTIEEKAKAYDSIIEKANKMHSENCEACKACIEELIPELAESEDERIRKVLIKFFSMGAKYNMHTDGIADKDIIAWLEKQELKSNPYSGVSFNYNGNIWGMCARDNGVDISCDKHLIKHLEEQGEQNPAEWSEEDEYRLNSCLNILQPKTFVGNMETINTKWLKSLKERIGGKV